MSMRPVARIASTVMRQVCRGYDVAEDRHDTGVRFDLLRTPRHRYAVCALPGEEMGDACADARARASDETASARKFAVHVVLMND